MKVRTNDTIVAIATPLGVGAISIVRMSGPAAIAIAEGAFRGRAHLSVVPSHTVHFGRILDKSSDLVDEVLVSVFRAPASYTGEDMAEINCHGGTYVTKRVLARLIEGGARLADPGEFTKRAFLNGKMDLSQAEAVADVISAGSERALRNSHAQLGGKFRDRISAVRAKFVTTCSLLELQLDFSDEGIALASVDSISSTLQGGIDELESILSSFNLGKKMRNGVAVAIVGRPNAGKSSLFNRLLMENRSIVSSSPGTTRDFLEESIIIGGMQVRLFDTAGLRLSTDTVEAEGVQRTRRVIETSDIVILVVDLSEETKISEDLAEVDSIKTQEATVLVVGNKVDLVRTRSSHEKAHVLVSAETGEGLESLRTKVIEILGAEGIGDERDHRLSSERHRDIVVRCLQNAKHALGSIQHGTPLEFVASDLRVAVDTIGEVTGEITTDEILNGIFSRFCIGK